MGKEKTSLKVLIKDILEYLLIIPVLMTMILLDLLGKDQWKDYE